jgi:hypothetical protein
MSLFAKLFGTKSNSGSNDQAVIVYLDGQGLPDEVYAECDLSTIEDQLIEVIERESVGEFDGNEVGPEGATLYMYSNDAERMFSAIEQTLRNYPLCQGARVVIRKGAPGATQREVILGP